MADTATLDYTGILAGTARAVASLADAVATLTSVFPSWLPAGGAVARGHFRPSEEEQLLEWFARFLTVRSSLWEVLGEVSRPIDGQLSKVLDTTDWRCFVLGYGAACLIVRLDRCLLEDVATESVVQRKLNEGSAAHRIPRKQFTAVFESFTDPRKAKMMDEAMRFVRRNRQGIETMALDPVAGEIANALGDWELALDPSRTRYGSRLLAFVEHVFRRSGASARQQTLFGALEASGRLVSEMHDHWTPPRIDAHLQHQLDALLQPGDVIVTRHDRALTNLFLPGYWPHAALYVGSESDRRRLGVELDVERMERWSGDRRVLEALKDGVLFRPLEQTLAVDAVAIIRPSLEDRDLSEGLARAACHEGKGYNFDFDFFRGDRLVCTEVVYRAFDGVGGIEFELQQRSGRPTLSAEDLLDLALGGRGFAPVAICGAPGCVERVVVGAEARRLLTDSYR